MFKTLVLRASTHRQTTILLNNWSDIITSFAIIDLFFFFGNAYYKTCKNKLLFEHFKLSRKEVGHDATDQYQVSKFTLRLTRLSHMIQQSFFLKM